MNVDKAELLFKLNSIQQRSPWQPAVICSIDLHDFMTNLYRKPENWKQFKNCLSDQMHIIILFFCWTHHFLLSWNSSYAIFSLFGSLFLSRDGHPELHKLQSGSSPYKYLRWPNTWEETIPTPQEDLRWYQPLRRSQMMPTPQKISDDANPSEDLRWYQPLRRPQMMPTPQKISDDANPSEDLRWCQPSEDLRWCQPSEDLRWYQPSEDLRWYQPLRRSQMMPTPQKTSDDANPSEDLRWCQPSEDLRWYQPLRRPQMMPNLRQHTKLPNLAISLIATYNHG